MTLPLYSSVVFFPGGTPAADWPVEIWWRASNQKALLFLDSEGDDPTGNPATTDGNGVAEFYAAPGDYVVVLAGELTQVHIAETETLPVFPGLYVHAQTVPSLTWTIAHHFGLPPAVNVILSGEATEAAIDHPDGEHTTITFGTPTAGVAHLRR